MLFLFRSPFETSNVKNLDLYLAAWNRLLTEYRWDAIASLENYTGDPSGLFVLFCVNVGFGPENTSVYPFMYMQFH